MCCMRPEILRALEKVGIKELNELQKTAYPKIKSKRNCLIVAPTGSGKTEAALIPIIEEIFEKKPKGIALLYITPLRALNRDMLRRIRGIAEQLNLTVAVRHGDTEKRDREKQSKDPPQILITTPETFQILFLGKNLRKSLKNVKYLVIDEVHELIDNKRGVQLSVAIERLRELTSFQIIAMSATIGDKKKIMRFFKCDELIELKTQKKYEISVIYPETKEEDYVLSEQLGVSLKFASVLRQIKEIIESHKSTLIFVNTRQTAEALALKLKKIANVEVHHGSLSKDVRIENERKLMEGEIKALICTSSLELGIDIGSVDCVIQFGSPREVGRLIQRIGRSGHKLEKVSKGFVIVDNFDDILESAVIVKRAKKGWIERPFIHENCVDALANQVTSLSIEYKRINLRKAFEIISRAYPYRNLKYEEFEELCRYFSEIKLIGLKDGMIYPLRRTRRYFYDNISMIIDEKHYIVKDIVNNRVIGILDESFLQTFEGNIFAMKGEVWRIVSIDDVVKVVPESYEAEIPTWVGEEIPVPFEVATDVGRLRETLFNLVKKDKTKAIKLLERLGVNKTGAHIVIDLIKKQDIPPPTDKRIIIEEKDEISIVNACFGHKVNEALGRILALLVSIRTGRNVSVEVDPYRIKLTPAEGVEDLIKELPVEIEGLLERALIDTKLFQWKLINVARKCGYLSKDIELSKVNVKALVQRLADTPIYRETLRDIFTEKVDLINLKKILRNLNKFEIVTYKGFTPIGLASPRKSYDIFPTMDQTEILLENFKQRLENEECYVICLNCGYSIKVPVKMVELSCPRCHSSMIACVNARRDPRKVSKSELFKIANLVSMHGMRAVYALNTYGIGTDTASRILMGYYPDEKSFFKALLEAEKNYIRTRAFWD